MFSMWREEERPGLSSGGLLMSLVRVHRHCQLRCSVSDANSAYCKGSRGETSMGSMRISVMINTAMELVCMQRVNIDIGVM